MALTRSRRLEHPSAAAGIFAAGAAKEPCYQTLTKLNLNLNPNLEHPSAAAGLFCLVAGLFCSTCSEDSLGFRFS